MTDRNTHQTEFAVRMLASGAKQFLYWSDNEAGIFCIDELQNKWVAVGTPQEILHLIASKGK